MARDNEGAAALDEEAAVAELISLVEGKHDEQPVVGNGDDPDLSEFVSVDKRKRDCGIPLAQVDLDEDADEIFRLVGRQRTYVVNHDEIPVGLIAYVMSITRSAWLANQVLDRAARKVLRRIRNDVPEARRARWAKRWRPEEQERSKRWLGRLRDEAVRVAHVGRVARHFPYGQLFPSLEAWQPDATGTLVVDEPPTGSPSLGATGYLEQTPPKLLRFVHETWVRRGTEGLGDEPGFDGTNKPRVWDLTAGSGTANDYFAGLLGCEIIASDLVAIAEGVAQEDCRLVGLFEQHGSRRKSRLCKAGLVVASPDIVVFDPPSRGMPLASQVYGDAPHADDLALLDRERWLFTVVDVALRAGKHLADGGVVSVLLRCGARLHAEVEADPELLDDFKALLGDRLAIIQETPLSYRTVRNQTSLGTNRVPAVHLLLARPT